MQKKKLALVLRALNVTFPFLTSLVIHSNISQYYIFLLTTSIFVAFL